MDEKLKSFADYETNVPYKKGLICIFIMIICSSVPTALLGIGSKITSVFFLPIAFVLLVWDVYLLFNTEKKRDIFFLFLGVISLYESLVFITASYKVISTVIHISTFLIPIALLLYFGFIIANYFFYKKFINSGYFLRHKLGYGTIFVLPCCILGYLVSKATSQYISDDQYTIITTIMFLFIGLVFSMGSINILKYRCIKQLEKEKGKNG